MGHLNNYLPIIWTDLVVKNVVKKLSQRQIQLVNSNLLINQTVSTIKNMIIHKQFIQIHTIKFQ